MAQLLLVDRDQLVVDVQRRLPSLEVSSPHTIRLAPVRTYIQDGKSFASGVFPGVVAPAFASHWGVLVGRTLYHLVFQNSADASLALSDSSQEGKPIKLACVLTSKNKISETPIIGETNYDHETLITVGEALIDAFGNYHRLFWNCQVFADCFLYLITNGKLFLKYCCRYWLTDGRWTSADGSQLFLCAFLITLPVATTLRVKEDSRKRKLEDMNNFLKDLDYVSKNPGKTSISYCED